MASEPLRRLAEVQPQFTPEEIYSPHFDPAWVEVPAVVTCVESGGIRYTLSVEVFGQTLKADVPFCQNAVARANP